jgi:hypothetical protein
MTNASTTAAPSAGRGALEQIGSAWTRFWFTPSDPISLSLMRILVGLVTLWWYLGFAPDLTAWFGTEGLFKPDKFSITRSIDREAAWSILEFATTPESVKFFYGLGFVAIVGMIVGILTRVFTIATLVWVLSFVHASSAMARPVDDVLAMLLFYLCIAPAGTCFSLDACLRARRQGSVGLSEMRPSAQFFSSANLATRLIQVHLAIIYAATAISQLQWEAWWQGSAVWWMMARSESRFFDFTPLSGMGTAFVYLVNFLTHFLVLYEICFATLIWNRTMRPILLWLGVFVWLGILLINGSPSFCLLMLIANLAFVPPETLRNWCTRCPVLQNRSPAVA